ncbi:MAG: TauD/TfdA family dioxygenase [Acetobacteraceae bacterium]|nr:TauD/TfdA family dioxygenase [Acetobacteraceae bacterium]
MASYRITPLTEQNGAEVVGIDFTQPVDSETKFALNDAWAKYHVLVMRDQKFTPEEYKRAALVFGELQQHDKREHHVPGHPDVYYVSNDQFKNGKRIIPGETFHTDHSNHPAPPKATMLFTVSLPGRGGDTQYADMHQAYDDLSAEMKKRIKPLRARHVYQSKYSPRELTGLHEDSAKQIPPPGIHPLVHVHPDNGRPALYLNPVRIEAIEGMGDTEALALIGELMEHATQKKYEYRHNWRQGDWVIWDNRSVMHQANADYDMNERRYLFRLMLKGSVPIPMA